MKKNAAAIILVLMVVGMMLGSLPTVQAGQAVKVGDYVQFGNYYGERILWRVIHIDKDGDPLLFAEKILCLKSFDAAGRYHTTLDRRNNGSNYWKDSNIRQWLNSSENSIKYIQNAPTEDAVDDYNNSYDKEKGFLADENFTEREKNAIKPVNNKSVLHERDVDKRDGGSQAYRPNISAGSTLEDTVANYEEAYYHWVTDKVFLLSVKELNDYVRKRGWDYRAEATKEAINNNTYESIFINESILLFYWLRTSYSAEMGVLGATAKLGNFPEGEAGWSYAYSGIAGIRPALYLKPSALDLKGEGTMTNPYVDAKATPEKMREVPLAVTVRYNGVALAKPFEKSGQYAVSVAEGKIFGLDMESPKGTKLELINSNESVIKIDKTYDYNYCHFTAFKAADSGTATLTVKASLDGYLDRTITVNITVLP